MNRRLTSVLLILCLFSSSCSSFKLAHLPAAANEPTAQNGRIVGPNANARVTLRDGRIIKGEVLRATSEELVLGRSGNYGIEEEVYPAPSIAKIEVEALSEVSQVAAVAVLVLSGVVVVSVISLRASGGIGGR